MYVPSCTLCLPVLCDYSAIIEQEDYSLDNNLRPYLYQTHAGELKCGMRLTALIYHPENGFKVNALLGYNT